MILLRLFVLQNENKLVFVYKFPSAYAPLFEHDWFFLLNCVSMRVRCSVICSYSFLILQKEKRNHYVVSRVTTWPGSNCFPRKRKTGRGQVNKEVFFLSLFYENRFLRPVSSVVWKYKLKKREIQFILRPRWHLRIIRGMLVVLPGNLGKVFWFGAWKICKKKHIFVFKGSENMHQVLCKTLETIILKNNSAFGDNKPCPVVLLIHFTQHF